jgi:hypothetical protein
MKYRSFVNQSWWWMMKQTWNISFPILFTGSPRGSGVAAPTRVQDRGGKGVVAEHGTIERGHGAMQTASEGSGIFRCPRRSNLRWIRLRGTNVYIWIISSSIIIMYRKWRSNERAGLIPWSNQLRVRLHCFLRIGNPIPRTLGRVWTLCSRYLIRFLEWPRQVGEEMIDLRGTWNEKKNSSMFLFGVINWKFGLRN